MNKPPPSNPQNLLIAMLLTMALLLGWPMLIEHFWPSKPHPVVTAPAASAPPPRLSPTRDGGLTSNADQTIEASELGRALGTDKRVAIVAPGLSGSINLAGGVIDDLTLNRYRASVAKNSGPERLFSPAGTLAQHFAQFGWLAASNTSAGNAPTGIMLPTGVTLWQAPKGARLTPATPLTLTWSNPTGQTFGLSFTIDKDYMITVTQSVTNAGKTPVSLAPFALIDRTERTASIDSWNIHSGPFGAFDGGVRFSPKYKDVSAAGTFADEGATNWLGFTDIYWMSVLIPDTAAKPASSFRGLGDGIYLANLLYPRQTLSPGASTSLTTRLFAGAKESLTLDRYEAGANGGAPIVNFGHAIDWGWFLFAEKPIFWVLRSIFVATGNFGVAIVLLTILVRLAMFPIAQRQFASMAAMRALAPKMKALQERLKGDRAKLQEETAKLYREEGVNPLAGCLPVFLQIPVFFALYKVLIIAIEMRQQPFVLWIRDLSVPDPVHVFNLFGLIPWDPPSLLALGPLALVLGLTTFLQFRLQPPAPDPTQQQMMAIMPWMMMFVMASFASGLLVYWITTNILVLAQQHYFQAKHPQFKASLAKEATARAGAPRGKP